MNQTQATETRFGSNQQILGGRPIPFLSNGSRKSRFPSLTRLCSDFQFRVVEVLTGGQQPAKQFALTTDDYRQQDVTSLVPLQISLNELEDYADENMSDILHDYMFGFIDEELDIAMQQLA